MKAIVWNKTDEINGISAYDVIKSHNIKETDEIFLVINNDRVTELQFKDIIASNYKLGTNLSCLEVAQKYLKIKQQEEQEEIEKKLTQQEEIEQIKQENASINYILMQNNLL